MNEFNRNWLNLALEYKDNPDVTFDLSQNDVRILLTYIEVLQSKIDKAIEFVESMEYCGQEDYFYDNKSKDPCGNDNTFNDSKNKLLNILENDKIQEIPQFKGTMEQLDDLCDIRKEDK